LENNHINILPEVKATHILEKYEGFNNYILRLKGKMKKFNHFKLTRAQAEYIINYENTKPKIARKWVDLDVYFAQKLMDDKLLTKRPEKIYIEKL